LQDFERFRVTGTAHGDFMIGGAGGDVLRGQGGNDTLSGGSGRDSLFGGAGDDVLSGNLGAASLLSGGSGDDTINASRLDDTIIGGDGFDRLQLDFWDASAGVRIDLVSGMPDWRGIEAISGELSRHDDLFRARVLTGTLDGGAGVDTLVLDYSRSGAEGVSFRFGLLTVAKDGLTQRQTASGFERFDLRGSAGGDSLIGDDLADVLQGLGGDDWLGGRGGRDLLRGGAGNDTLFGGAGDDTLDGGPGRDTLDGSTGNDVLTGGTGRDTFWFRGAAPGNDIITDFEAGLDRILIDPRHGPAPLVQSGADVLIDLSGQTLRVLNANLAEVQAAIDFADLVLA
jgi:Ca2+-binding RTX toxin-like protein